MANQYAGKDQKKKEPPKAEVDPKKEKMKNALFAGMGSGDKDSDSGSDQGEKKEESAPANTDTGMNLLDFDSGAPTQENLSTA